MAWYEGTMTTAAGQLKAILDAKLPLNSKWHIEDAAAGENIGVYHNLDAAANVDYIFVVLDNQADFATIQLWQGWDSVNHVGTGQSLTTNNAVGTYLLRINKSSSGYALRLKNHNMIFCEMNRFFANYVGQLKRYDESKNMPILICHHAGSATPTSNPLGKAPTSTTATYLISSWRALFAEDGSVRSLQPRSRIFAESHTDVAGEVGSSTRTIVGTQRLEEERVINVTTGLLMGELDGVCFTSATADGNSMANMETTDLNGIIWVMIKANIGGTIIEKS